MNRTINYNYYHWGPFLYKTSLEQEELNKLKKICSKKSKDYRKYLAGLIKHEHVIDVKKLFAIIFNHEKSINNRFKVKEKEYLFQVILK